MWVLQKRGTFVKMCRKLKYKKQNQHEMAVVDDFEALTFEPLRFNPIVNKEAFAVINVDLSTQHSRPTALKVKVDSGAQGDALPLRLYRQMFPNNIKPDGTPKDNVLTQSYSSIMSYGGHTIKQYGTCDIMCEYQGKSKLCTFYVTEDSGNAIIGLQSAIALNLISVNCSISEQAELKEAYYIKDKYDLRRQFPDVFSGVGKFEGQYHIT